jgi:hypothetical protein
VWSGGPLALSGGWLQGMEATMQVKITIEIDGQKVTERTAALAGTLEQMEETAIALGRKVACETLQAGVDAVADARPLFRPSTAGGDTKATKRGRCWA